jgi:hypothetical protein
VAALDLRGRVTITNGASGTLGTIQRQLSAIGSQSKRTTLGSFSGNAMGSMVLATGQLQQSIVGLRTALLGASLAIGGIIGAARNFNESKFGYGFARITEFIKDGKLQLDDWKAAMKAAGDEAQAQAERLGTSPETTMRAREEVEKIGLQGNEAKSATNAALALHLSEPRQLDPGESAKYIGAMYRAYEDERKKLAAKMGKDVNDPEFIDAYMKTMAARAAVAGSESALGPADLIEGLRQYGPQWGTMGISSDFALAALAHGSNYGFRAPELGTSYKSMVNRIIKPTAGGLRWYNSLDIDRSKFMEMSPVDPKTAGNRLNDLLGGALKGKDKAKVREMLDGAVRNGTTGTAEFRSQLANFVESRVGKGFTGGRDRIEDAVSDSILGASGFKEGGMDGLIREIIAKKAGPAALMEMFEGRHYARNTPAFKFYDGLYKLYEQLGAVGPEVADAITEGRKAVEAGQLDAFFGSLKNLAIAIQNSGALLGLTNGITALSNAIRGMPQGALNAIGYGLAAIAVSAGVLAAGGTLLRLASVLGIVARFIATLVGIGGGTAVAGATGAAAGGIGGLVGAGAGGVAAGMTAKQASKAIGRMGSATASGRFIGLGAGAAGAAASGAGLLGKASGWAGRAARALGWIGLPLMALGGAWGGYDAYSKGGGWWDVLTGTALGAIGMGGGDANAADAAPSTELPAIDVDQSAGGGLDIGSSGQQSVADAQAIAEQIRAAFASIDLSAVGQQMMASLAAGITAGGTQAVAAANNVASQVRAAGQRVQLNTGPNMQPAR